MTLLLKLYVWYYFGASFAINGYLVFLMHYCDSVKYFDAIEDNTVGMIIMRQIRRNIVPAEVGGGAA